MTPMRLLTRTPMLRAAAVIALIGAHGAASTGATEYKQGDALPEFVIETQSGESFNTTKPGDGVTIFLFDGHDAPRTEMVSQRLQSALFDQALDDTTKRLVYIRSRTTPPGDVPDYVESITDNVIIINDANGEFFDTFNIIVLPTVIVADDEARVVNVSSGVSPRFGDVIKGAILFAAGKIDTEAFALIQHPPKIDKEAQRQRDRAIRIANMAAKMAKRGMATSAEKMYRDALEIDPQCVPALVGSADIAVAAGDPEHLEQAQLLYAQALDADPDSTAAALGLAELYLQLDNDRLTDAETLLQGVIEHDPGIARAHDLLGQLHLRRGDLEKAKECYATRDKLLETEKK